MAIFPEAEIAVEMQKYGLSRGGAILSLQRALERRLAPKPIPKQKSLKQLASSVRQFNSQLSLAQKPSRKIKKADNKVKSSKFVFDIEVTAEEQENKVCRC